MGRMDHGDLEQRARERIRSALKRKGLTQRELAQHLGRGESGVSDSLGGKNGLSFDILRGAAELAGVDAAEFIAAPEAALTILNPFEAELVRYTRDWPGSVRTTFIEFLRYFAGESARESQIRRCVEYLRGLTDQDVRQRAESYLLFLREGGLTPDLRAAFGLPATEKPRRRRRRRATADEA